MAKIRSNKQINGTFGSVWVNNEKWMDIETFEEKVDVILAVFIRDFRGPEMGFGPGRGFFREYVPYRFPVYQVLGVQQREERCPLRRCGRSPVVITHAHHRRVCEVTRQHRVGICHRSGGGVNWLGLAGR